VYRGGRQLTTLGPTLDEYINFHQTVATPALRAGLQEDLYIVLAGWSDGGSEVTLKIFINPLASFLWLGGLVFLAGGAVAVWPSAQASRLPATQAQRRRRLSAAGLITGIALLSLAVWAMWGTAQGTAASTREPERQGSIFAADPGGRPRVGDPAPGFGVTTLDGSEVTLSELRGQVMVVNFWSPDCAPCEDEIPDLQAVWEEYRSRGVFMLGISFPELESGVRQMIADLGVTYPNALDLVAPAQYGITGIPETFVIGPQGRVTYLHIGPLTAERLRDELDKVMVE
jgi:peroxiredoxin